MKNKSLKHDLAHITQKKINLIIIRKLILIITFSCGLLLFSNGENFPFGMNYSIYEKLHSLTEDKEYKEKYKTSMDLVAQAGIKWWRSQGAFRWCDVQPQDSTSWDFSTEDSLVKWAGERGLHLLPVIGYTANWALHPETKPLNLEKRNCYPPDSKYWDKYENYIKTLVERYDGDGDSNDMLGLDNLIPIKYWQFSNEPYGTYFLGTPEQYAEMYTITRTALKSADSTAKIVGLCMTSRNGTFEWKYYDTLSHSFKTINLGSWEDAVSNLVNSIGSDNIDVVSHHIYSNTQNFMNWISDLRDIAGEDKPIWITETGFQNSDPFRAEKGRNNYIDTTTSYVTYSCNSREIFWDTIWAKWTYKKPCKKMIDTFLNIGDTVILEYRTDWGKRDTIIYNGGDLIYKGTDTALAVGDTLTIFDYWAEEYDNTWETQAENYSKLLISILNTADFLNNLKIFFFCADNTINNEYYPPKIVFGNEPNDTTYRPTAYYRQRLQSVWSVIDTNDSPLPAYYILRDYIKVNFP